MNSFHIYIILDLVDKQKGLVPLVIVILIALVIGGYLIYQKQSKLMSIVKVTTQSSPSPAISDVIVNWKLYKSNEYGFSFEYPSEMSEDLENTLKNSSTSFQSKDRSIGIAFFVRDAADYEVPWSGGKITTITKENLELFHLPGPNPVERGELQGRPTMLSRDITDHENTRYSIIDGNRLINIDIGSKGLGHIPLHNKILSTFKFNQ